MEGGFGWGSEAIAALSLWLSKLHVCRGWLAGWLPEKPVGMQGQGRGRRRLLPSFSSQINQQFSVAYLKTSSKATSNAKLCPMALPSNHITGGFSAACCIVRSCGRVQDWLEN